MKWFAILSFGLLAGSSLATKCDSAGTINDTFLIDLLIQGVNSVPVPAFEVGDVSGFKFAEDFGKASAAVGTSAMLSLHARALQIGDELIADVRKASCELQRSIDLIKKTEKEEEKICLDDDLKRLTMQVQVFLDLKPGNVVIKPPVLPDFPKVQTKIINQTEERQASEIFLHFVELGYNNLANFFGFVEAITLAAWQAVRNGTTTTQTQLRDEILNGPVMDAYRQAVDKVFDQRHIVQKNVAAETWKSFEEVGSRVVKISDDYRWSIKNKNCSINY